MIVPLTADDWAVGEERLLPLTSFGEVYRRYRLPDEAAEATMARSLARDGQLSPSIVCLREARVEMVDGFKRLSAGRDLGWSCLWARRLDLDESAAKAAIYRLNQVGRPTRELEEAWIVRALVREDGLPQAEVAELMGRHKSWVCRRLALLERLADECRQEMALGLISPSVARQLTRLPAGNQPEAMAAARRAGLNTAETTGFVDLLVAAPSRAQVEYLLERPREALQRSKELGVPAWDPRLTAAGNRVLKRLGYLIDALGRLESWFQQRGRADLSPGDRAVLAPTFSRLARDARTSAELCDDLRRRKEAWIRERFAELGAPATRFLEGLLTAKRFGWDQAQRVLALLGIYSQADVLAALERAARYAAFSLSTVERILAAQARPKPALESWSDEERQRLRDTLTGPTIPPRSTSEYQSLLFDEQPTDESPTQDQENGKANPEDTRPGEQGPNPDDPDDPEADGAGIPA